MAATVLLAPAPAFAAAPQQPFPSPAIDLERELFDPLRYAGRWYEVASLKLGFAGEGQGARGVGETSTPRAPPHPAPPPSPPAAA